MPRRLDSLSGRINQALDRYAWMIDKEEPRIRALFNAEQWAGIIDAAKDWRQLRSAPLFFAVDQTLRRLQCTGTLELSDAELIMLADIAEGEL